MFEKLLKKIAKELDDSSIPYMIIGGQAVLLYGEPRLTKDIDVTLGVDTDSFDKIEKTVANLGLKILASNCKAFTKKTMVLPAADEKSGIRVDFVFSFSMYEKQALARANGIMICGYAVKFASLEDIVVHKIIAGRPRDIEDVKSILIKNPGYDKNYIFRWLKDFSDSLSEDYPGIFERISGEIKSA